VPLFKPFGDEAGFVAVDGAVRSMLELENPTAVNQIDAATRRHKTPGAVVLEHGKLSVHGSFPR
jgi:hypothetical protein